MSDDQPRRKATGFIEGVPRSRDRAEALMSALAAGGESVRGRDFSLAAVGGRNLEGADLAGAILAQADFTGAHMKDVDLRDADLRRAVLRFCTLEGARLDGAQMWGAEVDLKTYQDSQWSAEEFAALHGEHGLQIIGLDGFPAEVRRLLALDVSEGLTLTFDSRIHRAAPALVTGLIMEVLGPDSGVGVEQQSGPTETPGFIRVNGGDPADLLLLAEAFYARLWDIAGASPQVAALLTELRDMWSRAAINHPYAQEWVTDQADKHLVSKDQRLLRKRWRRLVEAVGQDAMDRGRKLLGKRTFDTGVAIGAEILADVREWWSEREKALRERRADALLADGPPQLEDHGTSGVDGEDDDD